MSKSIIKNHTMMVKFGIQKLKYTICVGSPHPPPTLLLSTRNRMSEKCLVKGVQPIAKKANGAHFSILKHQLMQNLY